MFNAIMPPISVYLGAVLVNKIAEAHVQPLVFGDGLPVVIGLWITFVVQRAAGAVSLIPESQNLRCTV